ncbi:hypothetical protein F4778DRAFT_760748 [Xylariomycetidae sp. FL2044]|nr:hypothetical protein F4778DRAFT_760748 [Xylariomycetidae sp. FL2044]
MTTPSSIATIIPLFFFLLLLTLTLTGIVTGAVVPVPEPMRTQTQHAPGRLDADGTPYLTTITPTVTLGGTGYPGFPYITVVTPDCAWPTA